MSSWLKEFREFAIKGSVIDLAVGVIIGAAFGKIVSSLVADLIMPLVGILIGGVHYEDLVWQVGGAQVTYGKFIENVVDFVVIAFVVMWIARMFIKEEPAAAIPPSKTCPYCKDANAVDASKCRSCTSSI